MEQNEAEYCLMEAIHTLKMHMFQSHLCRDFILHSPVLPHLGLDHGLQHISLLLEDIGKRPSDYELPELVMYGRKLQHELQCWVPFSHDLVDCAQAACSTAS